MDEHILKAELRKDLTQEFEQTLDERVSRYIQVKPHIMTATTHFDAVSAEATLLFRDGHFYGCIALCQAVAEALVRFMCMKNFWKPSNNYGENVEKLFTRRFITEDLKLDFLTIWKDRDDYHHLNQMILKDRQLLERLAKERAILLAKIEKAVFNFSITNDGKVVLKYPQYWEKCDESTVSAFLKISP